MRKILILVCAFSLSGNIFAHPVQDAFKKLVNMNDFDYKITESGTKNRVYRYDSRAAPEKRYVLLSVNDHVPTSDELKQFNQELNVQNEKDDKNTNIFNSVGLGLVNARFTKIDDSPLRWSMQTDHFDNIIVPSDSLVAEVELTPDGSPRQFELKLKAPITVMKVIDIEKIYQGQSYQELEDGSVVPYATHSESLISVPIIGDQRTNTTLIYSDFKRTRNSVNSVPLPLQAPNIKLRTPEPTN